MSFAAAHKEELKLVKNGKELGCVCIPLVIKTFDGWGEKFYKTFKRTWKRLAASNEVAVRQELFGRISLVLMRQMPRQSLPDQTGLVFWVASDFFVCVFVSQSVYTCV